MLLQAGETDEHATCCTDHVSWSRPVDTILMHGFRVCFGSGCERSTGVALSNIVYP